MVVPGKQGRKLLRYFGMPDERVLEGMYGADPEIFNGGEKLALRPKTIVFVGQFIERKNVLRVCRSFLRLLQSHPDWKLHLCGSGEQRELLPKHPSILIEDFVQPELLAQRYRAARFFILPSHVEAWGLVVHEAALCGCALLLSNNIGSGDDLANASNAVRFSSESEDSIYAALCEAANKDDKWLAQAEGISRKKAEQFGPHRFADTIANIIGNSNTKSFDKAFKHSSKHDEIANV
jgi:glycosyltransferase involved in cell wall biosynthesis